MQHAGHHGIAGMSAHEQRSTDDDGANGTRRE